jgi:hypothetical protein
MTRYLLGELSEPDQEAIEADCFRDPDAFQVLLAVEDELFDAYAADELSGARRARFERRFLDTPHGQQRVEFARSLKRWAAANARPAPPSEAAVVPPPPARRAYRFGGLAAAAAVVVGLGWLFFQWTVLRGELARVRAEQAAAQARERSWQGQAADLRTRLDQLGEQLARERERIEAPERGPAVAPVLAFVLRPGLVRDIERPQSVVLPADAARAQIDLLLPRDEHRAYGATLQTPEGNVLWTRGSLEPRSTPAGRAVRVTLPATALADGHYVLSVRGGAGSTPSEVVAEYAFRLVKRR